MASPWAAGWRLALACRYRVAVGDERLSLGLPEVQLGMHPGFGGSVRTVRLLGVRPAMQMMLTGRPVRADEGARLGLVDRLVAEANWMPRRARWCCNAPRAAPPAPGRAAAEPRARCAPSSSRALIRQVARKRRARTIRPPTR